MDQVSWCSRYLDCQATRQIQMESEHKHARFSVFQIVDLINPSHGFRFHAEAQCHQLNNIAASPVPWEHGEIFFLSAVSKHVQVCLRQYIWSGSGGGVAIGVGFMCAGGSFHQQNHSHSSSPWAEALLPCKWTMERRPWEVCCYIPT